MKFVTETGRIFNGRTAEDIEEGTSSGAYALTRPLSFTNQRSLVLAYSDFERTLHYATDAIGLG